MKNKGIRRYGPSYYFFGCLSCRIAPAACFAEGAWASLRSLARKLEVNIIIYPDIWKHLKVRSRPMQDAAGQPQPQQREDVFIDIPQTFSYSSNAYAKTWLLAYHKFLSKDPW